MIDLLHGKDLEEYRAAVDQRKAAEGKHDYKWAKSFLDAPFETKIQIALARITEWVIYHEGNVCVSFSGGKDSTVLLDLVRRVYPDCPAVFCDTGLEYPEIRDFVDTVDNVEIIHPTIYNRHTRKYERIYFNQIIKTKGYPLPTKEIADTVNYARRGKERALQKLNGTLTDNDGKKSRYNCQKWKFLLDAPFPISGDCCHYMKKLPFKKYERETGRKPIIGIMASESYLRNSEWLRNGCNVFNNTRPTSRPLMSWTTNDILKYLQQFNIKYCSIYGDITTNGNGDYGTTGADRTGCMFCMFGVHLEPTPNRFQRMAKTHPDLYDYCINTMGLSEILDYINVDYTPDPQISLDDLEKEVNDNGGN